MLTRAGRSPTRKLRATMHDCDVLLIIIQVIAMLLDLCGIAATIWFLVGIPGWQFWLLSFYVVGAWRVVARTYSPSHVYGIPAR